MFLEQFAIYTQVGYPALQPLCGLGLPQECPKPLTGAYHASSVLVSKIM